MSQKYPFNNADPPSLNPHFNLLGDPVGTTLETSQFTVGICSAGAITDPVYGSDLNPDGSVQALWRKTNLPAWDYGTGTLWLFSMPLHWTSSAWVGLTALFVHSSGNKIYLGGPQRSNPDLGNISNVIEPSAWFAADHLFADLPALKRLGVGVNLFWNGDFLQCTLSLVEFDESAPRGVRRRSGPVFPCLGGLAEGVSPIIAPAAKAPMPALSSRGWAALDAALAGMPAGLGTATVGGLLYLPPSVPANVAQGVTYANDAAHAGYYYWQCADPPAGNGVGQVLGRPGLNPALSVLATDLASAVNNRFPSLGFVNGRVPGAYTIALNGGTPNYLAYGVWGTFMRNLNVVDMAAGDGPIVTQNIRTNGTDPLGNQLYASVMQPALTTYPMFVGPGLPGYGGTAATSDGTYPTVVASPWNPLFACRGLPFYSQVSMGDYSLYVFALGGLSAGFA